MDDVLTLHPDGVFLRREALAFGYTDEHLRGALKSGQIVRVRFGAYTEAARWNGADSLEQHRLRAHAVLRSHRAPLALSHTSAAVEHGLRLYEPDLSTVHVTCLDQRLGKTTPDLTYHVAPVPDSELVESRGGQLCVSPVRAAIETASTSSVASGLVVLDSVIDLDHATIDDVNAAFRAFHGPGGLRLQITVRLVRKGAQSVAETLMRKMMVDEHIPEPELQVEVRDSRGVLVAVLDFGWREHGVFGEMDGNVKYLANRRQDETIEETVLREKNRENLVRELTRWIGIRFVFGDIFRPTITGARIRRQLEVGQRLHRRTPEVG